MAVKRASTIKLSHHFRFPSQIEKMKSKAIQWTGFYMITASVMKELII